MKSVMAIHANLRTNKQYFIALFCIIIFVIYDSGNFYRNTLSLMHTNSSLIIRYLKVAALFPIAAISYYSVVCCLFSRSRVMVMLGASLVVGGILNAFAFAMTGSFLDAMMLGVALQERFFASHFIAANWKMISYVTIYSVVIFAVLAVVRRRLSIACSGRLAGTLVIVAMMANIFIANYTGGRRSAFFSYNAIIASAQALTATKVPFGPRAKVADIPCPQCPDLLVYIIDESVNYEALAAMQSMILQDAVLKKKLGVPTYVFRSYAAGNHSAVSNYVLRLGVGKSAYPDKTYATLRLPNIFGYAKSSHYTTIFYDAQEESKRLVNYMSQYDLVDIDRFMVSDASSDLYDRDLLALDRLQGFIDQARPDRRIAVVLVKNGVHFPYVNSVPPWLMDGLPAGCRSPDTSFSAQALFCKKAQYETALKFSVDRFMDKLFSVLSGKNFALVYTSDHGQNLSSKYSLPHGSTENTSECEISVPILVAGKIFGDTMPPTGIRSHFQIPPTLLRILGRASPDPVRDSTLWEPWRGGSEFLFEPFDRPGEWRHPVAACAY
ncbi:sulfatase-like hydrolase/transferase [uncultured Thiodictyon sp.]|uniref:sulfatase-like hydrolase/transferase n=1 Tax=uncultured Thiodictyon sp. TaxID=1846217 RepID=UPI0025D9EEAE|nr:sulfatase-like hydrolase/transferase [uncultured Thiodictyon sp.]